VPAAVVLQQTFDLNGAASVTETVTQNAPGYSGQYLWDFQVTNESYTDGDGMSVFAVPAEDPTMVSSVGGNAGWAGSVGAIPGEPNFVSWQTSGAPLGIGGTADFSFATAPTGLTLSNSFVSDAGLTTTPGGLLAVPTSAPVPPTPSITVLAKTDTDMMAQTINGAIGQINDGPPMMNGQAVTLIRFGNGLKGQTITLSQQLPEITAPKMTIDGQSNNIRPHSG
jgi:hypothetical protein